MSDAIAHCWLKLLRAEEHLDAFLTQLDAVVRAQPVELGVRRDGGHFDLVVSQLPDIPPACGVVLGDAIHNYRSALDHLAWALVARFGAKVSATAQSRIQFPMANSARAYRDGLADRLPGVPAIPHGAIIRRYQPYRRTDQARAIRLLRDLSNRDKHRILIPTFVAPGAAALTATPINGEIVGTVPLVSPLSRLNLNAPLSRIYVAPLVEPMGLRVEGDFASYATFGRGVQVKEGLRGINGTVRDILTEFDGLL